MKESAAREKSMAFAIRIVNLYKVLCKTRKEYVMARQVLKAGTSIGANLAEADCAMSEKDFPAKVYIAFKECAETKYWLELLQKTEFISMDEYNSIIGDCGELYRIIAAITKTTREKIKERK